MKRGDSLYVPGPAELDRGIVTPVQPGLLDIDGLARFLSVSVSTCERLVREGMPALDLAEHDHRRRPKRLLRFYPPDVIEWVRERGQSGNGSR